MLRRNFLSRMGVGLVALRTDALSRLDQAALLVDGRPPEEVARDEDYWFAVRRAFTVDPNEINLNSGSVSPAPRVVQEAVEHYLTITNMSPSLWVDEMLSPHRELVRKRLAAMAGADAEEIAITRNTSESLQIVQLGMELRPGDEILLTTQDYPRMITTWRQRERRDGVVLRTFPVPSPPDDPMELVEAYRKHITPRTRVIHMSHVTFTAGQIFPVREICAMARDRGIRTVVDGAHSFAHFPFSVRELGCDYFGTSLHKWLTAPVGTGMLYVRRELIPETWALTPAPSSMDGDIRKFEQIGTFPVAIPNSIGEAITFHESIGGERKAARLRYLRRRWMEQVEDVPGVEFRTANDDRQAGALSTMGIEGVGAQDLTGLLQERYSIHVRPRFVTGEWEGIRVTPNVFSTLEEVDTFATAIREIAAEFLQ
ncbi:MAG: aminotransferase class V-fold PLP-dependent enzyme [Gemmatimonadota bacterium]|nr:aminotransferase class V-fold PLP-dependent enzyme [Gemmatimonadota bacterium]MDH5759034.1 aminotransferase class V-fold PLP-dependent enzyme [Gemmatimonadota bacterium]